MENALKKNDSRNPNYDILRCYALFCVCAVHFFYHSAFGNTVIEGPVMTVMLFFRNSFLKCVPLFIILSGCLMSKKQLTARYYVKIVKIWASYLLSSTVILLFRRFHAGEALSFPKMISQIRSFSGAPYGWYVNMYIGLFLMIPFLNLIYRSLSSRRKKQCLIVTFLFLTSIQGILNTNSFLSLSWWFNPASSEQYQALIPSWWTYCYPLSYYFIGCYLNEYRPKMKIRTNLLLILAADLIFEIYALWRNHDAILIWGKWQDYGSILVVVPAVFTVILFINLPAAHISGKWKKRFAFLSECSFIAYLLSYIPDSIIYGYINEKLPTFQEQYILFLPAVVIVFISTLLLSIPLTLACRPINRIIDALFEKIVARLHIND